MMNVPNSNSSTLRNASSHSESPIAFANLRRENGGVVIHGRHTKHTNNVTGLQHGSTLFPALNISIFAGFSFIRDVSFVPR